MGEEASVYINGRFYEKPEARVSVFDHGILFGDGVFEGIRVYNRRVLKLGEHIDRLFCSAKAIFLSINLTKEEVEEVVIESCKKNNIADGYVRLMITRGVGDLTIDPRKCRQPTLICIASSIELYPEEMYEKGMPIITASQRRNKPLIVDPQVKSLNYLNNILAKIEANHAGVGEALMLNEDGSVAECTGDNIFIVEKGVLVTPPVHVGILNGITRQIVIQLAKENGLMVEEREFTLFNLYSAGECFLTGTAAEVIPVIEVDKRSIGKRIPGPVTRKVLTWFREYVRNEGTPVE